MHIASVGSDREGPIHSDGAHTSGEIVFPSLENIDRIGSEFGANPGEVIMHLDKLIIITFHEANFLGALRLRAGRDGDGDHSVCISGDGFVDLS